MTTQYSEAFAAVSTALAAACTASAIAEQPHTALVASIDQLRSSLDAIAASTAQETPEPGALLCASCIQDARNADAAGQPPRPVLAASTVVNGIAICDAEGRHRIVTAVQHAAAQSGRIILPGAGL